ncbi:hypothetical protein [Cyclobacterium sp.]|uniref:hypothetical protein n=1 Tax=Cyclobacterium sp. TaxID=1966343 RepID=UPI0019B2A533|nr:hypothetical protein [Cyclobacterium sp.]MBD3627414.1 hypothetical protein [Cyclobacterium sp.]
MHPYIPHLLEDIARAHRNRDSLKREPLQTIEDEFEAIERWISEDPTTTFGEYCGLKTVDFPPAEQLSDGDMELVLQVFKKMMFSWNLDIDLPKALPLSIAYTMTIDTLNQKTSIVNEGFMSFDYCSGSPEECIFKEYCSCLKYTDDFAADEDD